VPSNTKHAYGISTLLVTIHKQRLDDAPETHKHNILSDDANQRALITIAHWLDDEPITLVYALVLMSVL
jgi:hypothetical protein